MSRITTIKTDFSFNYFSNEDYEKYREYLKPENKAQRNNTLRLLNLYAKTDRRISSLLKRKDYTETLAYLWIEYSYGGMMNAIKINNSRNNQIAGEAFKDSLTEKTLIISGVDNKEHLNLISGKLTEKGIASQSIFDSEKSSRKACASHAFRSGKINTILSFDSLLSSNHIPELTRVILAAPMSPKTSTVKYLRSNPHVKVIDLLDRNIGVLRENKVERDDYISGRTVIAEPTNKSRRKKKGKNNDRAMERYS